MKIEIPSLGRAKIYENTNQLEIIIPSKKNYFIIIFLCVWLGGWFMGEVSALNTVLSNGNPIEMNGFMLFWLIGWTIGGGFAISMIVWQIFGQEVIKYQNNILSLGKQVLGFKLQKHYNVKEMKDLRYDSSPKTNLAWGRSQSNSVFAFMPVIKFDYGFKTIAFGFDLDEAESKIIIELISKQINKQDF